MDAWKTSRHPFGARYIFNGELFNFQAVIPNHGGLEVLGHSITWKLLARCIRRGGAGVHKSSGLMHFDGSRCFLVIAIYFPGGIILLKVASGDEPSGIWESEMETRAVRWQVFITRKWSKYVPAIIAMFHRLFQAMTFQLMFATSPLCLESPFLVP